MEEKVSQIFLTIVLILMNSAFLIITLKRQETYELLFNITTAILNIVYYGLYFIPDSE